MTWTAEQAEEARGGRAERECREKSSLKKQAAPFLAPSPLRKTA